MYMQMNMQFIQPFSQWLIFFDSILGACSVIGLSSKSRQFHSKPTTVSLSDMKILPIPALSDNYMYLLVDEDTRQCAAVDPVEPEKASQVTFKKPNEWNFHIFTPHDSGCFHLLPGTIVYMDSWLSVLFKKWNDWGSFI